MAKKLTKRQRGETPQPNMTKLWKEWQRKEAAAKGIYMNEHGIIIHTKPKEESMEPELETLIAAWDNYVKNVMAKKDSPTAAELKTANAIDQLLDENEAA